MHRVFVYGTLKKGFANHDRIFTGCNIKITPAWTYGELYDLRCGFPAMLDLGENCNSLGTDSINKVYGELVEFDDPEILRKIDRLEGYRGNDDPFNFYDRVKSTVFINSKTPIIAWIYLMTNENIQDIIYESVPSGVWEKK